MAASTLAKGQRLRAQGLDELPDRLPLMLDAKTCGQIAGTTAKCIRDQLAAGRIKGTKVGNSWRVNRDEFLTQMGLAEAYHG